MHYIRNLPEGLFILLVMAGPMALAYIMRPATFLGFLGWQLLFMAGGLVLWVAIGLIGVAIWERYYRR